MNKYKTYELQEEYLFTKRKGIFLLYHWADNVINQENVINSINLFQKCYIYQNNIWFFIVNLRTDIANYIRITYSIDHPLTYKNEDEYFACDESLFGGIQQWVVCLIIINQRLSELNKWIHETKLLKNVIIKNVLAENNIVTDSWSGSNFLDTMILDIIT